MTTDPNLFSRVGYDVDIDELTKTYRIGDTAYAALQGVSCRFAKGQITMIQGPSGCGKSTLLNILGGVDRPDSGRIITDGRPLDPALSEAASARYRLGEVGFVFQSFNLIPGLTAMDNLRLPMTALGVARSEQEARARRLLELVGMEQKLKKRPDALSGGEQQRVAVALALVNDPPLILADEPTGNLDVANARNVTALLRSLAHDFNKTVIVTTHDPAVAEHGDQILHVRDGRF